MTITFFFKSHRTPIRGVEETRPELRKKRGRKKKKVEIEERIDPVAVQVLLEANQAFFVKEQLRFERGKVFDFDDDEIVTQMMLDGDL